MAKFGITCTMIFNGYMEVEAENKEKALELAQDNLRHELGDDFPDDGKFGLADFSFGEATADYADEIDYADEF